MTTRLVHRGVWLGFRRARVDVVCKAWMSTTSEENEERRRILEAAAKHVGTHGWSEEALARGASDVGLSGASHGRFVRGPVELVEHVADQCVKDLASQVDASADELAALPGWRPRLERAIDMRLALSLPWHEHRAQALGLMLSSPGASGLEPAAFPALASVADELARATLVEGDDISRARWRARRAAAAGAYALAEARALTDSSFDLQDTVTFSKRVVGTLGDAAEAPEALRDVLRAGTLAFASLGGAALSFLPPKAVGALPQLLDIAASRATSTFATLADSTLDRILDALPSSPVPRPPAQTPKEDTAPPPDEQTSEPPEQPNEPPEAEVPVEDDASPEEDQGVADATSSKTSSPPPSS